MRETSRNTTRQRTRESEIYERKVEEEDATEIETEPEIYERGRGRRRDREREGEPEIYGGSKR